MYYRYEIRDNNASPWEGITSKMDPDERRMMNRFLREPKWYKTHPDSDSECWFTEYGWNKYKNKMQEIIDHIRSNNYDYTPNLQIRLRKAKYLPYLSLKGKVQCIRLLPDKEIEEIIAYI